MSKKIILDVDTGSDDAVAIMLAYLHPEIDLVAVCTVNGNVPLKNTTENTLRVLDLMKANVPVYKGCATPIVRDLCPYRIGRDNNISAVDENGKAIKIHSDYLDLPIATSKPQEKPAPIFYVDYLKAAKEKITIVAVGPLTNLATAFLIDPTIVENIEEIVIMGGGCDMSNVTSSAEFNFYADPEAAQRVLHCGAKITLIPLDITHRVVVTKDDVARFKQIGTPAALFACEMCETRILVHTQCQPLWLPDACSLHDPLAVAYVIDPSVVTESRLVHVDVSLSGLTDGATIVDQRTKVEDRNVNFTFDGDRTKFINLLCEAFQNN